MFNEKGANNNVLSKRICLGATHRFGMVCAYRCMQRAKTNPSHEMLMIGRLTISQTNHCCSAQIRWEM